jgi:CheY-like chemotaxis protein
MSSRILLVEDDLASLNNLSFLLREEGYEVAEAGDGGQAFKLLERDR